MERGKAGFDRALCLRSPDKLPDGEEEDQCDSAASHFKESQTPWGAEVDRMGLLPQPMPSCRWEDSQVGSSVY